MKNLMVWLDKNKTYLASIALPTITFAVSLGMNPALGAFLASVIGLITGGGKLVIDSAVKNETTLGVAIVIDRVKNSNK